MIEFKENDLPGGWSIGVLVQGVTVGYIRKPAGPAKYAYHKGPHGLTSVNYQDEDLDALKARVTGLLAGT